MQSAHVRFEFNVDVDPIQITEARTKPTSIHQLVCHKLQAWFASVVRTRSQVFGSQSSSFRSLF